MFTQAEAIMGARDLNPAFTPTRHPDPVCARYLARYSKNLAAAIVKIRPEAMTVSSVAIPLNTYNYALGAAFPSVLYLVDVRVHRAGYPSDALAKVDVIPAGDRHTRIQQPPAAWLSGSAPAVLTLIGNSTDYAPFDVMQVRYVALPTDGELPFPDDALDVCVLSLGAFLADRHASGPDTKEFNAGPFHANAAEAQQAFMDRLTNQAGAEVWRIKRV